MGSEHRGGQGMESGHRVDRVWGQDIWGVRHMGSGHGGVRHMGSGHWGSGIWDQDRVWGQDIGVVRHMVMVSQGYGSGQSYRGCRDMVVDRDMGTDYRGGRDMGTGLQGW